MLYQDNQADVNQSTTASSIQKSDIEPHLTINCLANVVLFNKIKSSMESIKASRVVFVSSCCYRAGNFTDYLDSKLFKNNHK